MPSQEFWDRRGHHVEALKWLTPAFEKLEVAPTRVQAHLHLCAGRIYFSVQDPERSVIHLLQAGQLFRELDDQFSMARTMLPRAIAASSPA